MGIINEEGEWITQKIPETNGDLVFDLKEFNGSGRIRIEVDHSEMYMSKIVLR